MPAVPAMPTDAGSCRRMPAHSDSCLLMATHGYRWPDEIRGSAFDFGGGAGIYGIRGTIRLQNPVHVHTEGIYACC